MYHVQVSGSTVAQDGRVQVNTTTSFQVKDDLDRNVLLTAGREVGQMTGFEVAMGGVTLIKGEASADKWTVKFIEHPAERDYSHIWDADYTPAPATVTTREYDRKNSKNSRWKEGKVFGPEYRDQGPDFESLLKAVVKDADLFGTAKPATKVEKLTAALDVAIAKLAEAMGITEAEARAIIASK